MLFKPFVALALLSIGCSGTSATAPTTTAAGDAALVDEAATESGPLAETATPPHDAAAPADMGPPSAECLAHCACMQATCTSYSGYPYADEGACIAHCAKFNAAEMKCWSNRCLDAKKRTGSNKEHDCRHAWGTWGVEECP